LRTTHEGLHHLRPGEVADLLEDLRRDGRQELLNALTPGEAADALEEMEPDDLVSLLREVEPEQASRLLSSMEPDEAADALRDLPREHREELLALMPAEVASPLLELLGYPEDSAGGFMTTILVTASTEESAGEVADRLAETRDTTSTSTPWRWSIGPVAWWRTSRSSSSCWRCESIPTCRSPR